MLNSEQLEDLLAWEAWRDSADKSTVPARFMPWVETAVCKFTASGVPEEDLRAEAVRLVLQALKVYEPGQATVHAWVVSWHHTLHLFVYRNSPATALMFESEVLFPGSRVGYSNVAARLAHLDLTPDEMGVLAEVQAGRGDTRRIAVALNLPMTVVSRVKKSIRAKMGRVP